MDCEKCFEVFASQEEYSTHLRGHYGSPASIPTYYSMEDYPMGWDYANASKKSWLSKTDMRRLLLETHGAT